MMKAAASTGGNPGGSGMHSAAGARVWVPKPPVPLRQATLWPTCRCFTPSPTARTTPAYSEPGTKGRAGFIWYLFCTISRSGKFRLAAWISISTSPALGSGGGSSFHVRASTPPGFSHSQRGWAPRDTAAQKAAQLVAQLLPSVGEAAQRGEPWLLNVNIPNRPANDIRGFKVARLGRRHAAEQVISQTNPRGDTMYWIGGAGPAQEDTQGTALHPAAHGYATITPLQRDLTDHDRLPYWAPTAAHLSQS